MPVAAPDSFQRMALQAQAPPAWLLDPGPHADIVLSTRLRVMRNLTGHRFPHAADRAELTEIQTKVIAAAGELEVHRTLTNAERDYLVGCRLISPEFQWTEFGRSLLLDESRTLSIMVNEEDHLRFQAVVAGWAPEVVEAVVRKGVDNLGIQVDYAWNSQWGYLASSPANAGSGIRHSAMFHLIGLAQSKRLPSVIRALADKGMVVRGLFGESSRAVGAFIQVSILRHVESSFTGACEYLIDEERKARRELEVAQIIDQVRRAREFAIGSRALSLADAVRILGWMRWAAEMGEPGCPTNVREVDRCLTRLEIHPTLGEAIAGRQRADTIRTLLNA